VICRDNAPELIQGSLTMLKPTAAGSLRQQLIQTFEDPSYRPPPLPSVALEMVALASQEDVEVGHVVRLLERDQLLAASVMKLIGSPIYAGRTKVRTLQEAVARLGIRTVRDAVFETALKKSVFVVPAHAEVVERMGRHGIVTAYLTRLVCRHARVDEDHAFLCGLLHDIGFSALLFALGDPNRKTPAPPLLEVWAEIDAVHETASKVVTKLWGLPPEIAAIVANHHHVHTGASARIAAVVNIADSLTERFSANIVGPKGVDGVPLPACAISESEVDDSRSVLALTDPVMARISADAAALVTQIGVG
jgi:HD-like signal output (HDOD) protein